jgi:hypothetical protein
VIISAGQNLVNPTAYRMLGQSTFTAAATYDERFGPGSGCFLEQGTGMMTAKSGNAIWFAHNFRGCEPNAESHALIAGTFLIYNGTKKLAGAKGSGNYTVSSNGFIAFMGTLVVR